MDRRHMDLSPPEREVVAAEARLPEDAAFEHTDKHDMAVTLPARQRAMAVRSSFIGKLRARGLRASRRVIRTLRRTPIKL